MIDNLKWKRILQNDFSWSVMNDTKWNALIQSFRSRNLFPHFRVKSIDAANPSAHWETGFPEHLPFPYIWIEWVEFDPLFKRFRGQLLEEEVSDKSAELQDALREAKIPYCIEEGNLRVYAHVRRGHSPRLIESKD